MNATQQKSIGRFNRLMAEFARECPGYEVRFAGQGRTLVTRVADTGLTPCLAVGGFSHYGRDDRPVYTESFRTTVRAMSLHRRLQAVGARPCPN